MIALSVIVMLLQMEEQDNVSTVEKLSLHWDPLQLSLTMQEMLSPSTDVEDLHQIFCCVENINASMQLDNVNKTLQIASVSLTPTVKMEMDVPLTDVSQQLEDAPEKTLIAGQDCQMEHVFPTSIVQQTTQSFQQEEDLL